MKGNEAQGCHVEEGNLALWPALRHNYNDKRHTQSSRHGAVRACVRGVVACLPQRHLISHNKRCPLSFAEKREKGSELERERERELIHTCTRGGPAILPREGHNNRRCPLLSFRLSLETPSPRRLTQSWSFCLAARLVDNRCCCRDSFSPSGYFFLFSPDCRTSCSWRLPGIRLPKGAPYACAHHRQKWEETVAVCRGTFASFGG